MPDTDYKIPKSLRDALIAGEVVPFVGAGVSMTVKKKNDDSAESDESLFPSWKGYVKILAEALRSETKPNEANLVEAYIKSAKPKYLEAMQHAFEELPKSLWYGKLNEKFKKDESEATENSLELPKLIWQLGSNIIFTTNIDRVLEWKSVKEPPIDQLNRQNVEFAQLQADKNPLPTIFYLHGRVGDNENIVFTRQQYDDFYKNDENEAKLKTLQSFLTTKSFLFIGFSLDDAYFLEELKNIRSIYKGGAKQYYALIKRADEGKLKEFDFVTEVYYENFGEPLLKLVREMRDYANKKEITPISVSETKITKLNAKQPSFNIPYKSKGTEFVGRRGKIKEIWNLLSREGCASIGQAVSVKGFGGLGKTQLAVEYAHAYKDEYKNGVFWVVADQNIDNQLLQIAEECGWIIKDDKSVNQFEVAKARFRALSGCLILFDNVETYADIEDYLPKLNPQTHLLITSREKQSQFKQIDLELLERGESRELLLRIANRAPQDENEKAELEKILEILGDIPLAVELVGGYLAEHDLITFAKYRQYLEEVPLDRLEKEFPDGSFTRHDRSIIQTLRISEKIVKDKPLMVEILKVLAWSGSSAMGISLLKTLVEADDELSEAEKEFKFNNALAEAHNLRLLKKDEEAERYAIHRLLAKVIRHAKPLAEEKEWQAKIVKNLTSWFNERANRFENLAEFEAEIEHLEVWQEQTIEALPVEAIELLQLRGNIPYQRGNYQSAFDWYQKAVDLFESKKPDNKKLFAGLFNDLGMTYGYLGNHKKALEYKEKALELQKELFGEKHPDTTASYNNVGMTYGYLGNHKKALEYKEKALELQKELFGEKHPDTTASYNNVGTTYGDLGNHKKALEYKEKALELQKELFGEKHPNTASSYNNVGGTYGYLGNHKKALEYKEKALELQKELFGEKHPNTASSYNNVGMTYGYLGNHKKALEYQEKALELQKELFGEKHPNTASSYNNVGGTYGELGNHKKALEYQEKALELQKELFGEKHPDTTASYNNVGMTYGYLGNYQRTLEYLEKAFEIHQELLGKQHPKTTLIAGNLINTYLKLGSKEKAGRKAAEFFGYVPQNHPAWKWFEEISRPYRQKKNRHKKRR